MKPAQIEWVFPSRGLDAAAPPESGAEWTRDCLNVRPHRRGASSRRLGGTRPGLVEAAADALAGGSPVQHVGWLDTGYGDERLYREAFDAPSGPLTDLDDWTADAGLTVGGGAVRPTAAMPTGTLAAEYDGLSGDLFEDFTLETTLGVRYGTTAELTLWAADASGGASSGARLTVGYHCEPVPFPGVGFAVTVELTVESGANAGRYARSYGVMLSPMTMALALEAGSDAVRVLLDGREVASCARDDGVCSRAGFSLSMENPTAAEDEWFPDSMIDARLEAWSLRARSRSAAVTRRLVAVAGRQVWTREDGGGFGASPADTDTLADVALVSAASMSGQWFCVDGTQPRWLNPQAAADAVRPWQARRGRMGTAWRGVVNWQGRMVLFDAPDAPDDYLMSRRGDAWDFDLAADDGAAAVSGRLGDAGRAGGPITACCPLGGDGLLIASHAALWLLRGDPAAGGDLVRLAEGPGALGSTAWTADAAGRVYLLGREGLFRVEPSGAVASLSRGRAPALAGLRAVRCGRAAAAGETFVSCLYEPSRDAVQIFLAAADGSSATGWYYDVADDALWPEGYPAAAGARAAAYFPADDDGQRGMLLGTSGGRLYAFDDSAAQDTLDEETTAAIASHLLLGPAALSRGFGRDAVARELLAELDSTSAAVTCGLRVGDTPAAAASASASHTLDFAPGRNGPLRVRCRGRYAAVRLQDAAGGRWALRGLTLTARDGGPLR